jgi:HEAT repeat protein
MSLLLIRVKLKSPRVKDRIEAALSLAESQEPGVVELLVDALNNAAPDVRSIAAEALAERGDRLGGRRPLDLLREGEIQEVLDSAREFGQHGAA